MKTVKVYQWRGVGSLSLLFLIDGRKKEIEFPTGTEKPRVNARFETSDPVIQAKIEGTTLFADGQIKCISTKNIAEPSDTVATATPDPKNANTVVKKGAGNGAKTGTSAKKEEPKTDNVFAEVTNYQQAAKILAKKFNIAEGQLQDPETIMAKAAEVNATFPNLIE